jgi:hypothetical protein
MKWALILVVFVLIKWATAGCCVFVVMAYEGTNQERKNAFELVKKHLSVDVPDWRNFHLQN